VATSDFLDEKRNEIGARIELLKPLVEEYRRLEAAVAALDGVSGAPAARSNNSGRRASARASAPASARTRQPAASQGRRGRPKGSGARRAQALALVTANAGITIPEIAQNLGIKQNYLYRVLPGLVQDGLVVKDGRGWKAKNPD
jgi:CRP-like cAMP-binding protein